MEHELHTHTHTHTLRIFLLCGDSELCAARTTSVYLYPRPVSVTSCGVTFCSEVQEGEDWFGQGPEIETQERRGEERRGEERKEEKRREETERERERERETWQFQ